MILSSIAFWGSHLWCALHEGEAVEQRKLKMSCFLANFHILKIYAISMDLKHLPTFRPINMPRYTCADGYTCSSWFECVCLYVCNSDFSKTAKSKLLVLVSAALAYWDNTCILNLVHITWPPANRIAQNMSPDGALNHIKHTLPCVKFFNAHYLVAKQQWQLDTRTRRSCARH